MPKPLVREPQRERPSSAAKQALDTLTKVGRKVGNKLERREVQRPPRMMLGTRG